MPRALLFLEPIGIGPRQRLDERALAVIDVAGGADDEGTRITGRGHCVRRDLPVCQAHLAFTAYSPFRAVPSASPAPRVLNGVRDGRLAAWPRAGRSSRLGCAWLRRGPRLRSDDAHGVQDLAQPEVDLPPLEVHANHLHVDLVAEPVDAAVLLAAQQVRALDEAVVVVGHRRDVHHALRRSARPARCTARTR